MFIILVIILSVISFSLKLGVSSLDLAEGVSKRFLKKSDDSEIVKNTLKGVARVGLATSKSFMRLSSFIIARVRDLVVFVGSFVLVLDIVVFVIIIASASTSLVLFTDEDNSGELVLRDDLYISSTSSISSGSNGSVSSMSEDDFVKLELSMAKEVADYVRVNKFTYGNAPINPAVDHSAKKVSCDRFVGWVLYKLGYTDQPITNGLFVSSPDPSHDLATFCKNHGFKRIDSLEDCQAGDIMFQGFASGKYHTYILGYEKENGLWERYDGGSDSRIRSVQPSVESKCTGFSFAYRPKALEN